jgi:transmembrane sensor
MQQKDFHDILKRYLDGKASPDDEKIIDAWYEAMGKGPHSLLSNEEESDLESRYWSTISGHVKRMKTIPQVVSLPEKRRGTVVLWYASGIAASLLLFMAFYFYRSDTSVLVTHVTPPEVTTHTWTHIVNTDNATKRVTLPDGSGLTLEPQSRLKYSSLFNQTTRDVYFEGDALFEVQRDEQRPFIVHTREVTTTVLGTSFRVRALEKDKDITVAVRTGRVSVSAPHVDKEERDPDAAEIILTPNQQVIYDRYEKTILRKLVEVPLPILPPEKVKLMRFEEGHVAEIFDAIEKVYGVEIVFDKERFSSCALTTSISDGGLYNRLDIICKAIGAEYTLHDHQIEIKGTGCN